MFRLNSVAGKQLQRRLYTTGYEHLSATKQSFIAQSGIYPAGFRASGVAALIKKNKNKDVALVVSDLPCSGAAVFTTNKFQAAPVLVSKATLAENNDKLYAVVTNSGCANAVTGVQGIADAKKMRSVMDELVKHPMSALTMSTGVVGQHLPMDKIESGIRDAYTKLSAEHEDGWMKAAEAYMTTDTFPKLRSGEFDLQGGKFRMAGISKGAGMIHPNMATLLGFMVTDAYVKPELLQKALTYAVDRSFNSISIDGDMSTNDTISVLANGASDVRIEREGADYEVFRDRLTAFAAELAQLVVRDGEGATKFVTLHIKVCIYLLHSNISVNTMIKYCRVLKHLKALKRLLLIFPLLCWLKQLCTVKMLTGVESVSVLAIVELMSTLHLSA